MVSWFFYQNSNTQTCPCVSSNLPLLSSLYHSSTWQRAGDPMQSFEGDTKTSKGSSRVRHPDIPVCGVFLSLKLWFSILGSLKSFQRALTMLNSIQSQMNINLFIVFHVYACYQEIWEGIEDKDLSESSIDYSLRRCFVGNTNQSWSGSTSLFSSSPNSFLS